jgi:TonB-linked SusC/RagA family outer membrane protein
MATRRSIGFLLVWALCGLAPDAARAQTRSVLQVASAAAESLLDRPARLRVNGVSLAAALDELTRTSGVPLAYSPSLLPRETPVHCQCSTVTVRQALDTILGAAGLNYRAGRNEVIISPRRAEGTALDHAIAGREFDASPALGVARTDAEKVPAASLEFAATISGIVTSAAGAPVADAEVSLASIGISTATNVAGHYELVVPTNRVVAGPDSLFMRRLGYASRTVPFTMRDGDIRVDAVLTLEALPLDAIVVTGTAGNQQRRAQPAVVATINAADVMAKAPVSGVTQLFYGRVPGVSITTASGSTGASSRISIRGRASLNLSNDPLVFVDGVRIFAGQRSTAGSVGGQQIDGLSDLDPADIESVEIVKGPAAATLYGADASAGVIQILTKRGAAGRRSVSQTLTVEYQNIDPNFTPETNYYRCTAADVAPTSQTYLCKGLQAGAVVTDNPPVRQGAYRDGQARVLNYSAIGSGQDFGYFISAGADDEDGTARRNSLERRTGRVNFHWAAHPRVTLDAGIGVARSTVNLAMGDQASYGYLIGSGFGSPRTVRQAADGSLTGGWLIANESVESISSILNKNVSTRLTPTATLRYEPTSWFRNEIVAGADYLRQSRRTFYPKNDKNWYDVTSNTGLVAADAIDGAQYSLTYAGNLRREFGEAGRFSADFSFGSQYIQAVSSSVSTVGSGLVTNSANAVSQTSANRTGSDGYGESKEFGVYGQVMIGFRDRLFFKFAERVDRASAFARNARTFLLPSAGISYVLSEEPAVRRSLPDAISTLKLRLAYGETGRAPGSTATLQTYVRAPYLTDAGVLVVGGVAPGNPGNPDLKPERGTEFEGGIDLGLFGDRLGLELTYFDKTSKDLIVTNPLPVSAGYSSSPSANIGEISNRGFELSAHATLVNRANLIWDVGLLMNTLHNEIVAIENVNPINDRRCFKPGLEIAAWCVNRIQSVDTLTGVVIVSDTAEFLGGQMPKREGSLNTTATFFGSFRLYAQADGKFDFLTYNNGAEFRDRLNGANSNSQKAVLTREELGMSQYEWTRLHPTAVRNESGASVGLTSMREDYFEDGSYIRLREVSLTWTVPPSILERIHLSKPISLTVGGNNLALWTDYSGYDPEVEGANSSLFRVDLFTVPQTRRLFARARVQF